MGALGDEFGDSSEGDTTGEFRTRASDGVEVSKLGTGVLVGREVGEKGDVEGISGVNCETGVGSGTGVGGGMGVDGAIEVGGELEERGDDRAAGVDV